MTIIAAYQDAGSYLGAGIRGTTPKTVKRVIQRSEALDLVAVRVKKSAGRISAKRLLPAADDAESVDRKRRLGSCEGP